MSKSFYEAKFARLVSMQAHVAAIRNDLMDVLKSEEGASVGSTEELSELIDALDNLEEQVDALAIAVEPLASVLDEELLGTGGPLTEAERLEAERMVGLTTR